MPNFFFGFLRSAILTRCKNQPKRCLTSCLYKDENFLGLVKPSPKLFVRYLNLEFEGSTSSKSPAPKNMFINMALNSKHTSKIPTTQFVGRPRSFFAYPGSVVTKWASPGLKSLAPQGQPLGCKGANLRTELSLHIESRNNRVQL